MLVYQHYALLIVVYYGTIAVYKLLNKVSTYMLGNPSGEFRYDELDVPEHRGDLRRVYAHLRAFQTDDVGQGTIPLVEPAPVIAEKYTTDTFNVTTVYMYLRDANEDNIISIIKSIIMMTLMLFMYLILYYKYHLGQKNKYAAKYSRHLENKRRDNLCFLTAVAKVKCKAEHRGRIMTMIEEENYYLKSVIVNLPPQSFRQHRPCNCHAHDGYGSHAHEGDGIRRLAVGKSVKSVATGHTVAEGVRMRKLYADVHNSRSDPSGQQQHVLTSTCMAEYRRLYCRKPRECRAGCVPANGVKDQSHNTD